MLAVLLRAGALATAPPLSIDEVRYLVVSHHVQSGAGYSDWRGPETHVHPLQPVLVALAGHGGASLETRGRLTAMVSSILLLLPIALLAARLGGVIAAALALLLAGVGPWLVRAAPAVQPEGLYAFLVASGLLLLLGRDDEPIRTWRWGAAGTVFGLSYLARPEGFLVGLVAVVVASALGRRAGRLSPRGLALFLIALLLVSLPYLLFLRRATGAWTLTGKGAHVFFMGQADHLENDPDLRNDSIDDLKRRYGTAWSYFSSHPGEVLSGAAENAVKIILGTLPRAIGPAGILGLAGAAAVALTRRALRLQFLLVASPCITLVLLLFSFPTERVAATMVPFLLVLASAGLAAYAGAWFRGGSTRAGIAVSLLFMMAMIGWVPAAGRAWMRPAGGRSLESRAVARALEEAGRDGVVLSNNPVLSFYAGDPRLLGPAGEYHPLSFNATCGEIEDRMRHDGARAALLDIVGHPPRIRPGDPDCPLQLPLQLDEPTQDRVIQVLTLPPETRRMPRKGNDRMRDNTSIVGSVGGTPLVELRRVVPGGSARVLVKLEGQNPTGSMKDRMALSVVDGAVASGRLKPSGMVVEYTGGSTGTSLAFVCAARGFPITLVTSDAFSREKRDHMRALGATLIEIPSEGGGTTKELIRGMMAKAAEVSALPGRFFADQFNNPDAAAGYAPLAEEMWEQSGGQIDAFVQSVGTAQCITGVARVLRARQAGIRIVAVEPAESPVLSGGAPGAHKIEGVGPGFIPPVWKAGLADEILTVSTSEAKEMTRRLAREEALFAGTSSGANVVAALRVATRLGPGRTVATLLCDSGLKYLSTDLYSSG
jgi:cysteine synthase A